jgi:uncharacterized metal-binding protein YceD (DUF177 family)
LGKVANVIDAYSINFKGLKLGKHLFSFQLGRSFFSAFEEGEIHNGELVARVSLNKQSRLLEFSTHIEGMVEIACDRCLEQFNFPVEFDGKLIVKIDASQESDSDEIIYLSENDFEVNLAQYLYESIYLSMPIERYHGMNGTSASDCDSDMVSLLGSHGHENQEVDPRWDKLKSLTSN